VEKSREARQKAAPVWRNKQVSNQVRAAAGKQETLKQLSECQGNA